jgi:hypothetical protein
VSDAPTSEAGGVAPKDAPGVASVEDKSLLRVVEDAVARVRRLTDAPLSPEVLAYVLEDSPLARILRAADPIDEDDLAVLIEDHSSAPVAASEGGDTRSLAQVADDLRPWLARPGREAAHLIARLSGDIADAIARSEQTDPADHEARVDLVLTVVSRVDDPRVAEVRRSLAQISSMHIDGWGMVVSVTQAASLLDRKEPPGAHLLCYHRALAASVALLREGPPPLSLEVVTHPARRVVIGLGRPDGTEPIDTGDGAIVRRMAAARTAALTVTNGVPPETEAAVWSTLGIAMPTGALCAASELTFATLSSMSTSAGAALLLFDALGSATEATPSRTSSIIVAASGIGRGDRAADAGDVILAAAGIWGILTTKLTLEAALEMETTRDELVLLASSLDAMRTEDSEPPAGATDVLAVTASLVSSGALIPRPHLVRLDWERIHAELGGAEVEGLDPGAALLAGLRTLLATYDVDPVPEPNQPRRSVKRAERDDREAPAIGIGMWHETTPMVPWLTTLVGRLRERSTIDVDAAVAILAPLAETRRTEAAVIDAVIDAWDGIRLTGEVSDFQDSVAEPSALEPLLEAERWLEGADPLLSRVLRGLSPPTSTSTAD